MIDGGYCIDSIHNNRLIFKNVDYNHDDAIMNSINAQMFAANMTRNEYNGVTHTIIRLSIELSFEKGNPNTND